MKKNIKKITVKYTVHHLIDALWHHPDCPKWLQDRVWDVINDRIGGTEMNPLYWKCQMQSTRPDAPQEHEAHYGMLDAETIEGGTSNVS